jgi:DNA helicase-4
MELKATSLGKRLAQHPYDRVVLLNAGVKVSGERHEYLIPFNQLLAIHCKRGLVWGELEFVLPDDKVVRLHGTEWAETQRFHHHLNALWQQWSQDMSVIAAQVLQQVLDDIAQSNAQQTWLTRQQTAGLQQKIRQALSALPLSVTRLDEFDNCRDAWRQCQAWLNDKDKAGSPITRPGRTPCSPNTPTFSVRWNLLRSIRLRRARWSTASSRCWCWRGPVAVKRRCWWRVPAGC